MVAVTDSAGAALAINRYDDYGIPAATNMGRFQYTGQTWMPDLAMYNYEARVYSPTLGRFMQTDPIGYGDGLNMYAYVGNDPINGVDPSGMITVFGDRDHWLGDWLTEVWYAGLNSYDDPESFGGGGGGGETTEPEQVVTARRPQRAGFVFNLNVPQNDDIVVTGQRPSDDDGSSDIIVTASRFILAKDTQRRPQGPNGGPNTGCMQMFNACHSRADSFPNDRDAHNAYLECRDALRVCTRIENMPTTDGFIYVRGVGWVWVSGGRSYFLPVPRSWRQP